MDVSIDKPRWSNDAIKRLWKKLGGIYGNRFFDDHGTEPNETWIEAVTKLDYDQILNGLDMCLKSGDDHPCNLSKFIYRCRSYVKPLAHRDYKSLPSPDITPEKIKENRLGIKNAAKKIFAGKRSVYLPGENPVKHQAAKAKAISSGVSEREFRLRRLELNGWSREQERKFLETYPHLAR